MDSRFSQENHAEVIAAESEMHLEALRMKRYARAELGPLIIEAVNFFAREEQ
jgi:hypothetical protein